MPPDRVCAAAGRADASDAPTSAPRISRRWGLKSCMGEILAPPRGARRTPWPVAGGQRPGGLSYSAGAAAAEMNAPAPGARDGPPDDQAVPHVSAVLDQGTRHRRIGGQIELRLHPGLLRAPANPVRPRP